MEGSEVIEPEEWYHLVFRFDAQRMFDSFVGFFFLSLLVARFSWTISVILSKITSYVKSAPAKTHTHYFILFQDTRLKYL